MKDQEWSGLMKIPDKVVISLLRKEIGVLKSEIDELKYDIDEFISLDNKRILHGLSLSSKIIELTSEIEKLQSEVKRQQKANTKLLKSIVKSKRNI